MARYFFVTKGIHVNRNGLSRLHLLKLSFLEIGRHPQIGPIYHRAERLPGLYQLPTCTARLETIPEAGARTTV